VNASTNPAASPMIEATRAGHPFSSNNQAGKPIIIIDINRVQKAILNLAVFCLSQREDTIFPSLLFSDGITQHTDIILSNLLS
jgi:hypothetical protein